MFETTFIEDLHYGTAAAVSFPEFQPALLEASLTYLLPDEKALADTLQPRQQWSFAAGRVAMKRALEAAGGPALGVTRDRRGAPLMPSGWTGSISHKDALAIAFVAHDNGWRIGIDIEPLLPERPRIARLTLTENERAALPEPIRWEEILLRFSAKEAIYKAIDPFVQRYVTFKEVETIPEGETGHFDVRLLLAKGEALQVEAKWRQRDGYFITEARSRPLPHA